MMLSQLLIFSCFRHPRHAAVTPDAAAYAAVSPLLRRFRRHYADTLIFAIFAIAMMPVIAITPP